MENSERQVRLIQDVNIYAYASCKGKQQMPLKS
jgi:hypothetical protein